MLGSSQDLIIQQHLYTRATGARKFPRSAAESSSAGKRTEVGKVGIVGALLDSVNCQVQKQVPGSRGLTTSLTVRRLAGINA